MPRGVTETTRGSSNDYPLQQSYIAMRNATEADLEVATQRFKGQLIPIQERRNQQDAPSYRCTGARLDSLRRLILDLVRADLAEGEAGHA